MDLERQETRNIFLLETKCNSLLPQTKEEKMKVSWATNLYDDEGDVYENCLLLFLSSDDSNNPQTILKFENLTELKDFLAETNRLIRDMVEAGVK